MKVILFRITVSKFGSLLRNNVLNSLQQIHYKFTTGEHRATMSNKKLRETLCSSVVKYIQTSHINATFYCIVFSFRYICSDTYKEYHFFISIQFGINQKTATFKTIRSN